MTVTLPLRILDALKKLNPDRSRAIVKCVETVASPTAPAKPVDLIELTPGKALIVIGPCPPLRRIHWLRLVEIAPARFLLALPPGTAVEVLEVALQDLLQDGSLAKNEKHLLTLLLKVIRNQRRGHGLSSAELLLIDVPQGKASMVL